MQNTKRRIMETALELFSKKGFTAVGIRELSGAVGIKESSVYYHYQSKEAIFESLLHDFRAFADALQKDFDNKTAEITALNEKSFIAVGLVYLNKCLLDDRVLKFIRMLSIEQHVNAQAAELYQDLLFNAPLKQNETAIKKLVNAGHFIENDVRYMAEEYYAPLLYIFQRYFSSGAVTDAKIELANESLSVHLRSFYRKYYASSRVKDDEEV